MYYILSFILGGILGLLAMALIKQGAIDEMQSLIDVSRKALKEAESRLTQRNKFIKGQMEEIKDLQDKIIDLEANCEFLYNNLSAQKRN